MSFSFWSQKFNIIRTWIPSTIITLAITFLSLVSYKETGRMFESYDLLMHFAAYFAFGFFLYFPFKQKYNNLSALRIAIYILIIGLLFGSVLEIAQFLSPGRTPSIIDALSNLAGVTSSQILIAFLWRDSKYRQN